VFAALRGVGQGLAFSIRDLGEAALAVNRYITMSGIRHFSHICGIYDKFNDALYDIFLDIIYDICYNIKYDKNRNNENDNHGNARREASKLT
jgi:hypothetical protein